MRAGQGPLRRCAAGWLAAAALCAGCATTPVEETASPSTDEDANAAIAASVPSTDIVLVALPDIVAKRDPGRAVEVATRRGYDNQPAWAPDGRSLLFTSIVDGQQADVFEYSLNGRRVRQVTKTPQSEYSPTPLASEQWTCIHVADDGTQRLALYGLDGRFVSFVREDVTGVGYHRWLAHDQLAVFLVTDPPQLEILAPQGAGRTVVAKNIGRSLNRTTAGNLAYVAPDADGLVRLHEYDVASAKTTAFAALPSETADIVWLIDDSALVASDRVLYRWQRDVDQWQPWVDLSDTVSGAITRMAVDPAGQWLALVVAEPTPGQRRAQTSTPPRNKRVSMTVSGFSDMLSIF